MNMTELLLFASSIRYAPSHTLLCMLKAVLKQEKTIDATDFQCMHENDYERHVDVRGCVTRTQ